MFPYIARELTGFGNQESADLAIRKVQDLPQELIGWVTFSHMQHVPRQTVSWRSQQSRPWMETCVTACVESQNDPTRAARASRLFMRIVFVLYGVLFGSISCKLGADIEKEHKGAWSYNGRFGKAKVSYVGALSYLAGFSIAEACSSLQQVCHGPCNPSNNVVAISLPFVSNIKHVLSLGMPQWVRTGHSISCLQMMSFWCFCHHQ